MLALLAIFLLSGAALAGGQAADVSAAELREQQNSGSPPVILDVRTDAEFERGHISGAVHIPYDELDGRLGEIPASSSDMIVVYCAVGPRARRGERTLLQNGFSHVLHLNGGFLAWEKAGHPIERSSNR
jgi:rhodanese-related sulfurtransferase